MYKKIIFIVLFFCGIFLYGCSDNGGFQYEFDNFYGNFYTEKDFELNNTELNGLGYNLIKNNIVNIYEENNENGFKESIIISKKNSDKNLEVYAEENVANTDISGLKISKGKNINIDCSGATLSLIYYQGRYNMNQYTIYITDGFLKVNQSIYSISYATLDEKNRNNFSSSFKSIKCK